MFNWKVNTFENLYFIEHCKFINRKTIRRQVRRDGDLFVEQHWIISVRFLSIFEHFVYCPTTCALLIIYEITTSLL